MNREIVERIADAVLYEGYMLYPYRPSAVKNQRRWNFGVVYPRSSSEAGGGVDAWLMETQCLVRGGAETRVDLTVRFLRAQERVVGRLRTPVAAWEEGHLPDYEAVEMLEANGRLNQTWQEATECRIATACRPLGELTALSRPFSYPAGQSAEPLWDGGVVVGVVLRRQEPLAGAIVVRAEPLAGGLYRLAVGIRNLTPFDAPNHAGREEALAQSMLSTHTILRVDGGEFVSLIDPPEELREAAAQCRNTGTWPVLAGEEGERDTLLSSPIILYDYPQIAPESPGDLFDGTEIDEILSLRVMTLTEEEKREMRSSDERARRLLERTETLPQEHFSKLHGALRMLRPAGEAP